MRVVIQKNGQCGYISLGIHLFPDQWKNNRVENHPDERILNLLIKQKTTEIDRSLLEMIALGLTTGKNAKEITELLKTRTDPDYAKRKEEQFLQETNRKNSFVLFYRSFCNSKDNIGTRTLYLDTLRKIESYCLECKIDPSSLSFEGINKEWLTNFEKYCLHTERQNTASRHLRDIRAAYNAAIDNNLTNNYPFRRFKIKVEETLDKSYTASELRALFNHPCYPGWQQETVDMFQLMFCLIGINSVDLAYADSLTRGRLNYIRRKTHKPYSIKVEPEAMNIINKYRGENHLVNILEKHSNYKTYYNRMGKTLRKVGEERVCGKKNNGNAIIPDICIGSARTSWATIAQEELDIPRDVIAAALGHHTVDVTTTYLRTDWKKKVDEANRKVIDWVYYEKR